MKTYRYKIAGHLCEIVFRNAGDDASLIASFAPFETAGEGGPWGMALLGSYLVNNTENRSLADFLDKQVFAGNTGVEITPTPEEVAGFNAYLENYKACLPIEQAAVNYKR